MSHGRFPTTPAWLLLLAAGCISVDLPEQFTFLPTGTPFVVKGTATMLEGRGGPCLAWVGDNGVTYHLFQGQRLENDVFDLIVSPGVTSRLELSTRNDIELDCAVGTIVQVESVLEIEE